MVDPPEAPGLAHYLGKCCSESFNLYGTVYVNNENFEKRSRNIYCLALEFFLIFRTRPAES